jgi:hypothetical protein
MRGNRVLLRIWMVAAFALAAAVLGCAGTPGANGFSFAVTADMRGCTPPEMTGPDSFVGVCEAIRDVGPGAFMVTPGDFDPPGRVRAVIDDVLGPDYVWYPVVGNHELDDPASMVWVRQYNAGGDTLPRIVRAGPPNAVETCYSFDYANAHFVAINEYYDGTTDDNKGGDVSDPLYEWLAADLAANDKPIVFVMGHEPHIAVPDMDNGRVRHRGGSLDKDPERNHRFWTLLRRRNVTAYLCGHTHGTSIAKVNGVWQLDAGHARGAGDKGAESAFLMVHVAPDGIVRCNVYRSTNNTTPYRRTYTERLR